MLRFLTAGESHGPCLTAIIEGMPAGLPLMPDDVNRDLARRQRGFGSGGRMKIEKDQVQFLGGVVRGKTTGAPIAMQVANLDYKNWKEREVPRMTIPRPGHADLTGTIKYRYDDLRLALERASARETTMRVAVGAVARRLLAEFGIRIGSYVTEIGGVVADIPGLPLEELWARAEESDVRCPDPEGAQRMRERIREAMQAKDTLGGCYVVAAVGVPPGLGSHVHWDRRLSGRLAAAFLSIHAIKGIEIGDAFANARKRGTEVHDEIFLEDGRIVRRTNRAGGLEGGITTGEPLIVRVAMKPISTTLTPLRSVNLATREAAVTDYERSDFCAVPRAAVVGEAMMAWVLAEALMEKLGGDSIEEMKPRFAALATNELRSFGWG
jgi:chorismate synthase